MLDSPLQFPNAWEPMLLTDPGILTLPRLLQPYNVSSGIEDIPLERETDPNPLQPAKTPLPIEVTEEGIVISDKPTQLLKALLPISVRNLGC